MALSKVMELPSGVSVSYWRIGGISARWTEPFINVELYGYIDESARRVGKDYVTTTVVKVEIDLLETCTSTLGALLYSKLKDNSWFSDSADVLES
jgi:hypothetical protein